MNIFHEVKPKQGKQDNKCATMEIYLKWVISVIFLCKLNLTKAIKKWSTAFKFMKENYFQHKYPAKVSSRFVDIFFQCLKCQKNPNTPLATVYSSHETSEH